MDFDSLWGPKVTPGWTKEVSKRRLFWHLMPAGISPGPQGAPRSHFQNHLRLILEQFWSFWDIFAMVLGLKLQQTIAHSPKRQAANGSKQQQTAAKVENCSQEQPTTCVHSWLAWLAWIGLLEMIGLLCWLGLFKNDIFVRSFSAIPVTLLF